MDGLGLEKKIDIESFLKQGALLGLRDGEVLVGWGECFRTASPHPIHPSFYSNDFFLTSDKPWCTFKHNKVFSSEDLSKLLIERCKVSREWSKPDWDSFSKMFGKIKDEINQNSIEKAVLAVRLASSPAFSCLELSTLLANILNLSKGLVPYGMWSPSGGFLGATPELLFDHMGNRVYSGALASTARGSDSSHDLINDPKEMWEHRLVVDYLYTQFSKIGTVSLESPRLVSFGNISHLYTALTTKLKSPTDFASLVKLLHPTPALGIYPKSGWQEKLKTLGHHTGDSYASPYGVSIPMDFSRCIVAIRGVSWDIDTTTCVAGCGIVGQSILESEIEEIKHKLYCTLENLGIGSGMFRDGYQIWGRHSQMLLAPLSTMGCC